MPGCLQVVIFPRLVVVTGRMEDVVESNNQSKLVFEQAVHDVRVSHKDVLMW